MKIVLVYPQIPQNTGNVVRTCSVTGTDLVLVRPLGFKTTDRYLKRAGLDYWEGVNVSYVDDLLTFLESHPNFYLFSSKVKRLYTDVTYTDDCALVFGSETSGIPVDILERFPERQVTIPMKGTGRCLNLATSVAVGLYEALRAPSV